MISSAEQIGYHSGLFAYSRDGAAGSSVPKDRLKFLLVGPAYLGSLPLHPVRIELIQMGHEAEIVELARSDTTKNYDDDTAAVLDVAGESNNLVLVTVSRGVETIPRAAAELRKRGKIENFVCAVATNTGAPQDMDFRGTPEVSATASRYNEAYTKGIVPDPDNPNNKHLTRLKPETIRQLLCPLIKDRALVELIVEGAVAQRSAEISSTPLPRMDESVPVYVFEGKDDLVLNIPRAVAANEQFFGEKPEVLPNVGHLWVAEQPKVAATKLVELGLASLAMRSNNSHQ